MWKLVVTLAAGGLVLGAMGPSPRYLEELVVGGGYGSAPDGGMDLEANGDLRTDGSLTAGGGVQVLGDSGVGVDYAPGARLHIRTASDEGFAPALLLHNASQAIGTATGVLFQAAGADSDRAKGGILYQSTEAYGRGALHFLNSDHDGPGSATLAEDIQMTLTNAGRLRISGYLGPMADDDLIFLSPGSVSISGSLEAMSGPVTAGAAGFTRGQLTARHGDGGNAPGVVRLHAADGGDWFLFVGNDGTVRVSDTLPTSNTAGTVVGAQD